MDFSSLSCDPIARSVALGFVMYAVLIWQENYDEEFALTVSMLVSLLSLSLHSFANRLCNMENYGMEKSGAASTTMVRPTPPAENEPEGHPEVPMAARHKSCPNTDGIVGNNVPGYYLLNNGEYSNGGISHQQISDVINNSKLNDIYHQMANVQQMEMDKGVYFGRARAPLYFEPTFKI